MPNTSDTSMIRAARVRHACNTSEIRTTWVWHECHKKDTSEHECYTNDMSVTRVKSFDFDSDTSENIFSHLYVSYMENERLHGEEQFNSKSYLLEMPRFHAKMYFKSPQWILNFVMTKAISKSYTLDCSSKFPCAFLHNCA